MYEMWERKSTHPLLVVRRGLSHGLRDLNPIGVLATFNAARLCFPASQSL